MCPVPIDKKWPRRTILCQCIDHQRGHYLISWAAHRVRLSVSCSLLWNQLPIVFPHFLGIERRGGPSAQSDLPREEIVMVVAGEIRTIGRAPHRIYVLWKYLPHYLLAYLLFLLLYNIIGGSFFTAWPRASQYSIDRQIPMVRT